MRARMTYPSSLSYKFAATRPRALPASHPAAAVAASPPCRDDDGYKVARGGYVPMVAGGGGDGERVLVPVRLLGDPSIAELLDVAAERYGFGQPGVLRVPCDAGHLRRVVVVVAAERRKGGGRPA
uniref:Auxin responsive protein n=1 Tax=Oryza brachyantha TaxID=4533 RepID=J3LRC2_ORYBR